MTRVSREQSLRWLPFALLACFFLISGLVMGLSSDDDSSYLNTSQNFHFGFFIHLQDWSPLYILWFKVLHHLCPNPIACFFLSWGILAALLALIPACFRTPRAWLYTLILLGFPFLTINPSVSLFGAAILLIGTCLILRRQRPIAETTAIFCGFAFVTAFARPEFDYAVYLSAFCTLCALAAQSVRPIQNEDIAQPRRLRSIVLACTVLTLASSLFTITRHSHWARSGIAFAQHYNRRAAEHGIIPPIDSWRNNYAQRRFGIDLDKDSDSTTATVFDFLRANPRHFFEHMRENFRDPRTLELFFVFALFVLWPWIRRDARHLRSASVFVALIGIPCVAASIVIYPRSHYALVLIPSLLIYALQLFDSARWQPSQPITVFCAGCALIWLTRVGLPLRSEHPDTQEQVYLQQVQCVRQVDRTAPESTPAFESVPMLDVYFTHRRLVVGAGGFARWEDFQAAVAQQRPAWISVNDALPGTYGISSKQLDDTLRGPLNYDAHPCPFDAHLTVYEHSTAKP